MTEETLPSCGAMETPLTWDPVHHFKKCGEPALLENSPLGFPLCQEHAKEYQIPGWC